MPWRMPRPGSVRRVALKLRPAGLDGDLEAGLGGWHALVMGILGPADCALVPASAILPSIPEPTGALPARFRRRPALLIVGCGDVGLRRAAHAAAALAGPRADFVARSRRRRCARAARRRWSATSIVPSTLRRLGGWPRGAAPGAAAGASATATRARRRCCARWRAAAAAGRLVYGSTSGVYGDCGGARFDETRAAATATAPRTAPGRRRSARALVRAPHRCRRDASCASPASTRATATAAPARPAAARHAGADARRRRLHQPHPCRRPGARLRRGAVARRAAARRSMPATTPR